MPSIMTLLGSEHSVLIRSKFRSVLQLRLQQRRTREQLADQGIMPPLKSPAAFHEQRKSLERSKTGDYLKHKIRSRPDKSALVKMRILPDPAASEGSATPRESPNPSHKLKRARLADDLNEKLALRPGPLELVQKNIIPADCTVKEAAMRVNHGKFPKQQQQQQQPPAQHHQEDSYAFEEEEEDSSSCNESLSPPPLLEHEPLPHPHPHPHSDESQGSTTTAPACPSCPPTAADTKGGGGGGGGGGDGSASPSSTMGSGSAGGLGGSSASLTGPAQGCIKTEAISHGPEESGLESGNGKQATPPIPVPAIVKPPKMSDKNRHKKPKDIKPKVRKLKYHQYIPPDQKAEKSPPPMDSAYARLLQQQQLFLQLQILSQQKHQHHHQHHHQHQHQQQQQQQQQHSQCSQTQQHQQQTQQQQQHQQQQQAPQTQSFSYQPLHQQQANRPPVEQMSTCGSSTPSGAVGTSSSASSPVKTSYSSPPTINPTKLGPLPPNLDDLKVSELRQQLRIRGMPVSGTKTALIERLRPFRDPSGSSPASQASDITTVTFPVTPTGSLSSYQSPGSAGPVSHGGGGVGGGGGGFFPFCSTGSTPPISPASSELSVSGSLPDSFSDVTMSSPQFGLHASSSSPGHLSADEGLAMGLGGGASGASNGDPSGEGGLGLDAEKDKMLVEKQKVIEELTWKLHQEQRQVEELRMQLHKRKRSHGGLQDQPLPPPPPPHHHHPHPHPATGPQHPSSQGQNGPMAPHHHHSHQQHQHQHQHQQSPHGLHMHPNSSSSSSNQMHHNFYGNVSVKQEHVASSCPLASKAMKNNNNNSNGGHQNGGNGNGGSCMEGMGAHCGMMGAPPQPQPQRCPGDVPPSRSPSSSGVVGGGLSAFLSPQCSPQDSPGGGKTSGSPQPSSLSSSPSHSYMMTPPMGRDGGCAHSQASIRPRNMQIQQKAVSQPISCPYPPDQRGLQALYPPSPADMGLNDRPSTKAKNNHMQTKMAVSHPSSSSSRHPGPKCPVTSSSSSSSTSSTSSATTTTTTTAFCSSESDCAASKIKQPPCYEDAVKQQLTRSQQMDEILDVLIESGEMPANSKDESSCSSCVTKVNVPPHLAVSAAVGGVTGVTSGVHNKFHRHYSGHMASPPPPPQMPFEPHGLSHTGVECHLESLLSNPMVRQGDIVLLKLGEDGSAGEDIGGFVGAASHHHDDKMLVHRDMMDTPLSPMATKVSPVVPGDGAQGLGMAFAESPWETMEWLDLTPPSSATAFNSMATAVPSIFNTEFLDVTDINLNSAMDLHLEHW